MRAFLKLQVGCQNYLQKENNMKTPHKHAQAIKDWADGYEIEYRAVCGAWTPASSLPCWSLSLAYRRKPEIPKSGLTDEQLRYVVNNASCEYCRGATLAEWRAIADAAVHHFIQIDMNTYLDTLKGQNET